MKWLVRIDEKDCVTEWNLSETCFQRAAEEIAEMMDHNSAEYPDERNFEMFCHKKGDWRKVTVDAENVRNYHAMAERLESDKL